MSINRPHVERVYRLIGHNIRRCRRDICPDMSPRELGQKSGVSSIHTIEEGKSRVLPHQLKKIARVLRIKPEQFMIGVWQ